MATDTRKVDADVLQRLAGETGTKRQTLDDLYNQLRSRVESAPAGWDRGEWDGTRSFMRLELDQMDQEDRTLRQTAAKTRLVAALSELPGSLSLSDLRPLGALLKNPAAPSNEPNLLMRPTSDRQAPGPPKLPTCPAASPGHRRFDRAGKTCHNVPSSEHRENLETLAARVEELEKALLKDLGQLPPAPVFLAFALGPLSIPAIIGAIGHFFGVGGGSGQSQPGGIGGSANKPAGAAGGSKGVDANAKTAKDAAAFFTGLAGTKDGDGDYKGECVTLAKHWIQHEYGETTGAWESGYGKCPNPGGPVGAWYAFQDSGLKSPSFSRDRWEQILKSDTSRPFGPGDLVFFPGDSANGGYGHVAVVLKVDGDKIKIAEQNYPRHTPVRTDRTVDRKDTLGVMRHRSA